MNRKMFVIQLLCVWIAVPSWCRSDDLSPPVLIVFDGTGGAPEKVLERRLLVNEFCPEQFVRRIDETALSRLFDQQFYKFDDPKGYQPLGGLSYSLDNAGGIHRMRFRSVQNDATFDAFVASNLEKRGADASVSRTRNNVLISNSGPGEKRPSGATVRWMDLRLSYGNGVVVWGGESFFAPLEQLSTMIEKGRGHDWCYYFAPKGIPEEFRSGLVTQVERHASVLLQQRDQETLHEYAERSGLGTNSLELFRRLLADINECILYADEPTGDAAYHAHVEVEIRPNSGLAKLVQEVNPVQSTGVSAPADAVGSAVLNLRIPDTLVPVLHAVVANSRFAGTSAGEALGRQIDSKRVAAGVSLVTDSNGDPAFAGEIVSDLQARELAALVGLFQGAVVTDQHCDVFINSELPGAELEELRLRCEVADDRVMFRAIPGMLEPEAAVRSSDVKVTEDSERSSTELLTLNLDLQHVADHKPDSRIHQLLVQGEKAYQWFVGVKSPLSRDEPLRGFVSMVPRIRKEGDWKLQLKIWGSRDGERIAADCRIGRDLYGWLHARQFVSQAVSTRRK